MAKTIQISKPTSLPPEEIKKAVDEVFSELSSKYGLHGSWSGDKVFVISGQDVIGRLEILPGCLDVYIAIEGLIAAFSSMIEKQLKEKLDDKLPG